MWNTVFPISNNEPIDEDNSSPIYRSYPLECEMVIDSPDAFNEQAAKYKIYVETERLKPLVFTPKTQPLQTTSDYYFMKLDFKVPRPV